LRFGKIRCETQDAVIAFNSGGVIAKCSLRQAKIIQRHKVLGCRAQAMPISFRRLGIITELPIYPVCIVIRRRIRVIITHCLPETLKRRIPLFKTKLREPLIVPGFRTARRQRNRALRCG